MAPTPYLTVPEASLLLIKEGKVFLVRRANTGYEDGKYCFPAGHKEKGETPMQTAIREGKEEVGVEVQPKHLTMIHVMYRQCGDDGERPAFFFHASEWVGEPKNMEPEKADDARWFHLSELPEMMPYMKEMLERYRKGKVYSEFGWDA